MLTWLTATLGTGVVLAETIYDAGREQGYSKNKLIAARDEIQARTFKYGFDRAGAWMWTMKPSAEVTDAEMQAAYLMLVEEMPVDAPNSRLKKGTVPVGGIDLLRENHQLERDSPLFQPASHPQPLSQGGEREAGEAAAAGSRSSAQNGENFGVLRQKRGGNGGCRRSGEEPKPSRLYDGLSTEQLRETALEQLCLCRPVKQGVPEFAGRHVANGDVGIGGVEDRG